MAPLKKTSYVAISLVVLLTTVAPTAEACSQQCTRWRSSCARGCQPVRKRCRIWQPARGCWYCQWRQQVIQGCSCRRTPQRPSAPTCSRSCVSYRPNCDRRRCPLVSCGRVNGVQRWRCRDRRTEVPRGCYLQRPRCGWGSVVRCRSSSNFISYRCSYSYQPEKIYQEDMDPEDMDPEDMDPEDIDPEDIEP